MNRWIAIFRAGTHTDSAGKTHTYSRADIEKIAAGYAPARHEAPLVLGHPEADAPAYGWVEQLKSKGGTLLARIKQVPAELKEAVKAGRYKKVSVALYPDGGLRHVGLLGASPPAVKGLGNVAFDDGDEKWIEFSQLNEGAEMTELEKALKRAADAEAATKTAEARAKVAEAGQEKAEKQFTEADTKATEAEAAKAKAEKKFAEQQNAKAEKARDAKFAELAEAGKVLPAEKGAVMDVARALAEAEDITYSEDGAEVKMPAEAVLWKLLEHRPKHGLLDEYAEEPPAGADDGDAYSGELAQTF